MTLPPRLAHIADIVPKAYVYALLDPDDGKPRWVGSSVCPKERASQHWHHAKWGYTRGNQLFYEWLLTLSEPPPFIVLEIVPKTEQWEAEATWTKALYAEKGSMIFNQRAGKSQWLGDHQPKHF